MQTRLAIPSSQPFLPTLAHHLFKTYGQYLPDLSHVHVFIPNAQAARQLREALITQTTTACIGPGIGSLTQWLNDHVPLPTQDIEIISPASRQLLLFEALKQHRKLFRDNNLWQVCDSLLQLFDELSEHNIRLTDWNADDWQQHLQTAYGINATQPQYLQHEARIVHTLWQAWHEQTRAMQLMDTVTAKHLRLQQADAVWTQGQHFYVVGFEQLNPAEQHWCQKLAEQNQLCMVSQNFDTSDSQAFNYFLHLAYDTSQPLRSRAQSAHNMDFAPIQQRLSVYTAADHEAEARAIDMQIRLWLAQGCRHIGVISEDRKLGRRVRALLERSGVLLEDTAGWPLSTTSAAACLERWLECIEEDFSWQALLDVLKSPFFCPPQQREQHLADVFRFEQDIIIHERISSDLSRYKQALQQRSARLSHWQSETFTVLQTLLDTLDAAAKSLRKLYHSTQKHSAAEFITRLHNSLDTLHIHQHFAEDIAGQRLLQELDRLLQASKQITSSMSWQDFRTWLGDTLEQQQFMPQNQPASVQLMNLKQAQYCHFDALIIAGANAASLPGRPAQTAFFNHAVRHHLGIRSWRDDKAESFVRFRHLLQAAGHVLISHTREQDDEWLQPSPWLTSLTDFVQLAAGGELHNPLLHAYLQQQTLHAQPPDSNLAATPCPAPALTAALQPQKYSVSAYQRLVDCPYKFFAADGLSLKAEERITKELMKSEYGEEIHEILRAFFEKIPGLPSPFAQAVSPQNREQALQHLHKIANAVFARDSDDSMQRSDWQHNWTQIAPGFIDWLIERQAQWQFHKAEEKRAVNIDEHNQLHGRLDRIEKNPEGYAIIDYKTGHSPAQTKVNAGEDVQLISYAMLMDDIQQVAYLELKPDKIRFSAQLADEMLQEMKQQNFQRLRQLTAAIRDGQALPAWGDAEACKYCTMAGLCRKQIWEQTT